MGSAIPTPDCSEQKLASSSPIVENKTLKRHDSKLEFKISFRTAPPHGTENLSWLSLFRDTNIASGFPVPDRGGEIGLELSYKDFGELIAPYQAVLWNGGFMIRTSKEMFVPVKKVDDRVQWHVILSGDTKDWMDIQEGMSLLQSRGMPRALQEEVNYDEHPSTRFFLN
jgi:hypothetical protein